jgi:hypothetical protein
VVAGAPGGPPGGGGEQATTPPDNREHEQSTERAEEEDHQGEQATTPPDPEEEGEHREQGTQSMSTEGITGRSRGARRALWPGRRACLMGLSPGHQGSREGAVSTVPCAAFPSRRGTRQGWQRIGFGSGKIITYLSVKRL